MIPNASEAIPKIVAALGDPSVSSAKLRAVYQQVMNQATADAGLTDAQIAMALAMLLVRS